MADDYKWAQTEVSEAAICITRLSDGTWFFYTKAYFSKTYVEDFEELLFNGKSAGIIIHNFE